MDDVDKILAQWQQQRPDLDLVTMGPIGRMSRVALHNKEAMAQTFDRYGVNASGFDVLATLRRSPPPHALSPGALMDAMMISSGTMTNRIDQLVKAGLVVRSLDHVDARRRVVALTDAGFALIDRAIKDHIETQRHLLSALSPDEVATLDGLMRKMMRAAEDGDDTAQGAAE